MTFFLKSLLFSGKMYVITCSVEIICSLKFHDKHITIANYVFVDLLLSIQHNAFSISLVQLVFQEIWLSLSVDGTSDFKMVRFILSYSAFS